MFPALITLLLAAYHSGINNPNLCDPSEKAVTQVVAGMHAVQEKSVPPCIRKVKCEPLDFDCVVEEYEKI